MTYVQSIQYATPVALALAQVSARLQTVDPVIETGVLYQHVRDEVRDLSRLDVYTPTFFEKRVLPALPARCGAAAVARLRKKVNELEIAAAFCAAALLPVEKPLIDLLRQAQFRCDRFDEAMREEALHRERMKRARSRGGTNRHAGAAPAKPEAARLLRALAPAGGWNNPNEAVKAIIDDLIRFVLRERLPLVAGDYFERTVLRWIRKDPEISEIAP